MIDDKWLDLLEEESRGPYFSNGTMGLRIQDAKELIHLARLGLWAKKVAIPTLSQCVDDRHYHGSFLRHSKALEELPK